MKEYIKKFNTLASANNYEVKDIPFTATAVGSGNTPVNVVVNQSGATLSVSGNEIDALFVTVLSLTIQAGDGYNELTIQYEQGMTWAQWIASNYNDDKLVEVNGYVCKTGGRAEVHEDDYGQVPVSAVMDSTKSYRWID